MAALTFPLGVDAFAASLRQEVLSFDLNEALSFTMDRGGATHEAETADRLWSGAIQIHSDTHEAATALQALANTLRYAGRSFFLYDLRRPFPSQDPTGSTLGASTVQIASLNSDTRRLALKGLPASYVLSRGDYLGFTYGSSPVLYALHQVIDATVTANGSGITPEFEVVPHIDPGAAVDDPATLARPALKAQYLPGSWRSLEARNNRSGGLAFNWVQVLR